MTIMPSTPRLSTPGALRNELADGCQNQRRGSGNNRQEDGFENTHQWATFPVAACVRFDQTILIL